MAGRPAGLFACLAMAAALFVTIVLPAAARTGMDTAPASTVARSVDRIIVGYSPSTPAADKGLNRTSPRRQAHPWLRSTVRG